MSLLFGISTEGFEFVSSLEIVDTLLLHSGSKTIDNQIEPALSISIKDAIFSLNLINTVSGILSELLAILRLSKDRIGIKIIISVGRFLLSLGGNWAKYTKSKLIQEYYPEQVPNNRGTYFFQYEITNYMGSTVLLYSITSMGSMVRDFVDLVYNFLPNRFASGIKKIIKGSTYLIELFAESLKL